MSQGQYQLSHIEIVQLFNVCSNLDFSQMNLYYTWFDSPITFYGTIFLISSHSYRYAGIPEFS